MDFLTIKTRQGSNRNKKDVYPDYRVIKSKDLMVKDHKVFAVWDENNNIWSKDKIILANMIDEEINKYLEENREFLDEFKLNIKYASIHSTKSWKEFDEYVKRLPDNYRDLDQKIIFLNQIAKKEDYATKRVPYDLKKGSIKAYDELIGTLYNIDERQKLEWAIGSILYGDSIKIQKFIVLYGSAGTGKSTVLKIIEKLFPGYYKTIEAGAITNRSNNFATEMLREKPLVAIQHDGDLSRIEDNSRLNSIISHEEMNSNEKYRAQYMTKYNAMIFMATNKPVKITDSRSGIIRRLIDVHPSGLKVSKERYTELMGQIEKELGAIAYHCVEIYTKLGIHYYDDYISTEMMYKTDFFYNFVEDWYITQGFRDEVGLSEIYQDFKQYCLENNENIKMPRYKFADELKSYFKEFYERIYINGESKYSWFKGFKRSLFKTFNSEEEKFENTFSWLELNEQESKLDIIFSDKLAQYAKVKEETPNMAWKHVTKTLKDLDSKKLHYILVNDPQHIVIDFDLKDLEGNKDFKRNFEEARKFPETYAEVSKSGKGIHLHYIYDGDVTKLQKCLNENPNIEIKIFKGLSALRRKLTQCNDKDISILPEGSLPLKERKEGKKMLDPQAIKTEKGLRRMIERNLNKEIHPATKPSIDFINKILDDAYNAGYFYDVTDLRPTILTFANNSTNHSEYCVKIVSQMKFQSEKRSNPVISTDKKHDQIIFFDVEVFPNLLVICWKAQGKNNSVVKMVNPSQKDVEDLLKYKLIGFNCRRYDNHILYAKLLGYSNERIFTISKRIINKSENGFFKEAYGLSFADIYEYLSKKKSLKKLEIELGIHHQELGLKWDEPAPEDMWDLIAEYCANDVVATEAVFEAKKQDFVAREILADLSGLPINNTTQQHTAKIIFGDDPEPQTKFNYPDLSEMFPGYTFENGNSVYRGIEVGEGGYVYTEPGMYGNVVLLDVASMHPTSIIQMNMFGPYTKKFKALIDARLAIKNKKYISAKKMLNGVFEKYLDSEDQAADLSYALKIIINMVYGFTYANFESKFKDSKRNQDNKVAKRGALFMVDLMYAVKEKGFTVAHIKTDSIKIPDATPEIISFVMNFGKKYGYTFEHEATYEKLALVDKSNYVAKDLTGKWTSTGDKFNRPYIFKPLFSKEEVFFNELCETKSVNTAIYLDMNEDLNEEEHNYQFVGKVGSFLPIKEGCGGGILLRETSKENKYDAVLNTKGWRWLESEMVKNLKKESDIDELYFEKERNKAISELNKIGDFNWLISEQPYDGSVPFNSLNTPIELPWNE